MRVNSKCGGTWLEILPITTQDNRGLPANLAQLEMSPRNCPRKSGGSQLQETFLWEWRVLYLSGAEEGNLC